MTVPPQIEYPEYQEMLDTCKRHWDELAHRASEHTDRPSGVRAFRYTISKYKRAAQKHEEKHLHVGVDGMKRLDELCDEADKWLRQRTEINMPSLRCAELISKHKELIHDAELILE